MRLQRFQWWCGALLLLTALTGTAAGAFEARLVPDTVAVGETFALELSSSDGQVPRLLKMPPFTPRGQSRSTRSDLSGTRTSVSYLFVAAEVGQVAIPPLPVQLGKETVHTPELTLKVLPAEAIAVSGADAVFWRASFGDPDRKVCYVGEEIPLVCHFYMPFDNSFQLQLNYPEVQAGKSVFRDYRAENPENAQFAPPRESRAEVDGKLFRRITFRTAFRPLAPGKLTVEAALRYVIRIPERGRSDDFFGDFFTPARYRSIPKTLRAELPEITVKPLPPAPAGTLFTGLVGDWRGKLTLSQEQAAVQEPLTLRLELSGPGSGETLHAPRLELPGMRVYPPETVRKNGVIQLLYAMIPLRGPSIPVRVSFATFDPAAGKYRLWSIDRTLSVTGKAASAIPAETVDFEPSRSDAPQTSPAAGRPHTTLHDFRNAPSPAVDAHWFRNHPLLMWVLILAGPLFFVLHELYLRRRNRLSSDPDRRRRNRASAHHAELLRAVRTVPAAELPELVTGKLAGYFCDRWGLAPGATPEQVAEAARDPELATALRQCGECSYLPPESVRSMLAKDGEKLRKALLRGLKIVILALGPGIVTTAEAAQTTQPPATWQEALTACDRGNYAQAEQYFLHRLKTGGDDPNVLYNLGCIKAARNEPAQALWYLERAALRKPWNSAFQENRNLLRRRLFLPETGTGASPGAVITALRDRLRPDHYGVLAGIFWCALWVFSSFRRKLTRTVNWAGRIALSAGLALALAAMLTQLRTSYAPDRGIVLARTAELSSLPGDHNGKKLGALTEGALVRILEERRGWMRLTGAGQEGWLPSQAVGKLP